MHEFPLKVFLKCPICRGHISGSGSRGKKNVYYYYYHCSKCGYRISSRKVNPAFEDELIKYEYHEGTNKLPKKLF